MPSRSERGPHGRRRALVAGAVAAAAALVIAGLVLWSKSPVEVLSDGPSGRLTAGGQGVPPGPARYHVAAHDPVLVSGAAVVLDGATVRAVRLHDGGTYWKLPRPGGVMPQSLWTVDDRHVAIAWSDGRLTVVDVPTGRRWERYLSLHPLPVADYSSGGVPGPELAVYGLPAERDASVRVVLVQPGEVQAYDLTTGTPACTYTPPSSGRVVENPTTDAKPTGALLLVNLSTGANSPAGSLVLDGRGRVTMRSASQADSEDGGHVPVAVGGGRVAVGTGSSWRIVDAASDRVLYTLPVGDSPYDIIGGADVIVAGGRESGPVTAYDASDGRMLWQHQYTGSGPSVIGTMVMGLAVYQGQVRVLELQGSDRPDCGAAYRLLTIDATGEVVGVKPLSAFDCRPLDIFPRLVDGRDAALIAEDNASIARGHSDHTYVYVG